MSSERKRQTRALESIAKSLERLANPARELPAEESQTTSDLTRSMAPSPAPK